MTKSQQIRGYKEANPLHKAKDIAKACGVTTTYVYQVLHKAKKKKVKPVASKNGVLTDGQKVLREEMDRLHAEIANLQIIEEVNDKLLVDYEAEIEQLENDIIGYRAVISYLQGQLDGATV
jgi:tRNA A37 N6-isopentenylltransferase MiaA